MNKVLNLLAMTFVALFSAIWLWIAWRVWHFTPSADAKQLVLSEPIRTSASFLAASVGAGTAAVLGITIANISGTTGRLAERMQTTASGSPLLILGILTYFFVGVALFVVWLANPDEVPDLAATFATGILGWAGGAFSSVFKTQT